MPLRIVGGSLRGRRVETVEGSAVRPTSERAREALFNILCQGAIERPEFSGCRFLDLFAGTGVVAIEALSRGAGHAVCVDLDIAPARRNVSALGLTARASLLQADATRLGPPPGGPIDFAFLDPPYHAGLGPAALDSLRGAGWIAPGGLVVLETEAGDGATAPEGWRLMDRRRYGRAAFSFLAAG